MQNIEFFNLKNYNIRKMEQKNVLENVKRLTNSFFVNLSLKFKSYIFHIFAFIIFKNSILQEPFKQSFQIINEFMTTLIGKRIFDFFKEGEVDNIENLIIKDKSDLIKSKYEIDISKETTKVAVKIIDMLGEEVLIVKEI